CRIVVLISGTGSNLQSIIDHIHDDELPAEVVAVISNRSTAGGLEKAQQAHIPTQVVDHQQFSGREAFDAALMAAIDQHQPDLVVLAGFMRILTDGFVTHYTGRMLNIHPSRLPLYKGLNTHQRALDAGDEYHGASVHFVTPDLDGGPVILQSELKIHPDHNAATLADDVREQEHQLYPLVIRWFCQGRVMLQDNIVVKDGEKLETPLQLHEMTL
ncbi:unnamed protein product, partial [Cyprideis torosa]